MAPNWKSRKSLNRISLDFEGSFARSIPYVQIVIYEHIELQMKNRQKIRKASILVSFFLFPAIFYYLSPVLIIEASSKGIINGSFILFFLMFISSLFLGRAYCGWICPGAGCQEAIFPARDKKVTGVIT